jgi:hypothetical protein
MAKSPQSGDGRGRRAADRKRPASAETVAPESTPASADARNVAPVVPAPARPRRVATPEQVARRAYELYRTRGGTDGSDLEDWLQAERELNGK